MGLRSILFLKNGEVCYNCTILNLYDQSVISSITDRNITSDLAVRTLQKVLDSQQVKADLMPATRALSTLLRLSLTSALRRTRRSA